MCFSLKTCFCCVTLEVGAQVISIVSTAASGLVATLYCSAAISLSLPHSRMVFYSSVGVVAFMQFLFGCLLTHATFQKKPRYMLPWIVFTWSSSAALLAVCAAGVVVLLQAGSQPPAEVSSMLTLYVVYSVLHVYFASVVNSRRAEINRETAYYESIKHLMMPSAWKYT